MLCQVHFYLQKVRKLGVFGWRDKGRNTTAAPGERGYAPHIEVGEARELTEEDFQIDVFVGEVQMISVFVLGFIG